MKNNTLLILFGILSVLNIYASTFDNATLEWATKPLLLPILALYFYLETKENPSLVRTLILVGLLFSFGGDTLLLIARTQPQLFLLGLASFLITQMMYRYAFVNIQKAELGFVQKHWAWLLPFVLYLVSMLFYLLPTMQKTMMIPVAIYATVIMTMAIAALNLKGKVDNDAWKTLFTGVLLFVSSDSILAINKFKMPIPYAGFWIMSTYLLAQYLIVMGCIKVLKR